jgi:hypothetical protein
MKFTRAQVDYKVLTEACNITDLNFRSRHETSLMAKTLQIQQSLTRIHHLFEYQFLFHSHWLPVCLIYCYLVLHE